MIEMSGSNQAILRWFLTEAGSTGCVMDLYGALKLRAKRQMTTFMQNIMTYLPKISHTKKKVQTNLCQHLCHFRNVSPFPPMISVFRVSPPLLPGPHTSSTAGLVPYLPVQLRIGISNQQSALPLTETG